MNVPTFALAAVFLALGSVLLAQSKKQADSAKARNQRLGGMLMIAAGLVLFAVALFTYFGRRG